MADMGDEQIGKSGQSIAAMSQMGIGLQSNRVTEVRKAEE